MASFTRVLVVVFIAGCASEVVVSDDSSSSTCGDECGSAVGSTTGSGPISSSYVAVASSTGASSSNDVASSTGEGASSGDGGAGPGSGGGIPQTSGAGASFPNGGDVLDPREVYLVGTQVEGTGCTDSLVHWSDPNFAMTGFDCYFNGDLAQVRPTDGRLLYPFVFGPGIFEFRCDACPYVDTYPASAAANDPMIVPAPCDTGEGSRFLVAPSGETLHTCYNDGPWYTVDGREVYDGGPDDSLTHLGYDGSALSYHHRLVDLAAGTSTVVRGLPNQDVRSIRAARAPDAFLLVVDFSEVPGSDADGAQELWAIDRDAIARRVGSYPPVPPGVQGVVTWNDALDGDGRLFQVAIGADPSEDKIVRRDVEGASEIVYDEAERPLVKIHVSYLVTGP